ncbi:MAG: histidine kinase, partial [Bacteroidetes bacterium]|nr:histidine kinase [Bacteroidota bacterium]
PYNDYSSWFIGYSNNFELLFPPIENSGIPSWVHICGFANNDGDKYIATYFVNLAKQNDKLVFYEANGKEYSSVTFDFLPEDRKKVSTFMVPVEVDNKPYILWGIIDGYFILYNENIEIKKIKTELNNFDFLFQGDLNKDGNEELVFRSQASEYLIISDNILKNTVWIETNIQTHTTKPFNWGIKHNGEKQDELFIKAEDFVYLYSYKANLLYYLKFPIWIIIYGFVTLILWFSQRLQHIQEKRKQQVEQTINSLQMKTIKSQMDPHFMFNVLTGLANNVATGNTKEAHDQILRFSQLLRSMMDRTNKIDISLAEEIEFVRSYLELEKFRFRDDFEYNIKIEDGVDLNMRLPRMLIQLLVENSIKHGLKTLSGTQKLNIDIHHKKGKTLVVVEDNGIGRKAAMEKSGITGKGMKLINEMIRLNRKMGGKEISVDHTDLYDEAGKAAGTRVMVEVSPRIARISTN